MSTHPDERRSRAALKELREKFRVADQLREEMLLQAPQGLVCRLNNPCVCRGRDIVRQSTNLLIEVWFRMGPCQRTLPLHMTAV